MKHELKIESLHDTQASCSCGLWHFIGTGERTRAEVEAEWRRHVKWHKHKKGGE